MRVECCKARHPHRHFHFIAVAPHNSGAAYFAKEHRSERSASRMFTKTSYWFSRKIGL